MVEKILGIDIAKLKFDVALLQNNKYASKVFKNNPTGFEELFVWLNEKDIYSLHACLEATGIYGEGLSHYLAHKGFKVSVVNPAQIKGFAQSELSRKKTDNTDAKLIARYCQAMKPPIWQPQPQHVRELQGWVKRLEALQSLYREESNRLEVAQACVKPCIREACEFFSKKIKEVKNHIRQPIELHPDLCTQKKLLETIPGVGEATIAQMLSFIGTIQRFKNARQLVAFVGLNPRQRESGSSVRSRSRLSKTGSFSLRKALYMPAISAKQYNPIIKEFCVRLQKAGKPKMLIIGAAMRKLLHQIYGVLKSGKPFDASLQLFHN
ncbi:MAG: family transposase [Francisellaceae bacterium]|nr:family transposase [Francisellaceae bacterium]